MKKKVLISQRVPAFFRRPFFESLAKEVDLVVTSGESLENDSIKTFDSLSRGEFLKTKISYYLGGQFWFDKNWKKNIENHRPDIVVITPTPRMLSNYCVVKYCKKHSIRVVGWGMGEMPGMGRFQAFIHLLLAQTLVKKLDGMICYSTAARDYYVTTGISKEKCVIAYNSVDTCESKRLFDKLVRDKELTNRINTIYDLGADTTKLLFVGRLTKSKCVDALICSLEKIESKVELIIVGDGVYFDTLKKLASNITTNVTFTGHKTGEELAELFVASDLFVLPSLGGLAIQQAMSYGLPVIASIGDGTEQDLIDEGINGFVFREKDWFHLKECLNIALMDKEQLKVMGRNSLLKVTQDVNINNMVCSFTNALTKND
ncbi:MAG: glycosyltransferase involved in cell wall biosynthesis [Colwellia sp.]|jgi:glycosyltransferase involved in cell wall biosynthesis|uniref:Glycosyltransferase n=1 Tax=Colwellia sp. C1 TaxID=1737566 RepID=A0A0P0L408_9GAMM|nr:Glycosyltransferase [Colwellia sp. C1]